MFLWLPSKIAAVVTGNHNLLFRWDVSFSLLLAARAVEILC